MSTGTYYIGTGRDTRMYTLRNKFVEYVTGVAVDRDIYCCNLAIDWERAVKKAKDVLGDRSDQLRVDDAFSLEEIRRRGEEEMAEARRVREEERESFGASRRAELLGLINTGIMPWGKHKNKSFTDLVAAERGYCEYIANSQPMEPGEATPEYVIFASNAIKAIFVDLLSKSTDITQCEDQWFGELKKRYTFKATVIKVSEYYTNFTFNGEHNYLVTLRASDGSCLVHSSQSFGCPFNIEPEGIFFRDRPRARPVIGQEWVFKGTVKSHDEYRGQKQTRLLRVKLEEAGHE